VDHPNQNGIPKLFFFSKYRTKPDEVLESVSSHDTKFQNVKILHCST